MNFYAKGIMTRENFKLEIDLDFKFFGIVGIMGKSGSGKSSFFRWLSGFDYGAGDIRIDGIPLGSPHTRKIAQVFQNNNFFNHLSVEENILLYSKSKNRYDFYMYLTEQFKITKLLKKKPLEISGGEGQRVALVRALYADPKILLLDECLSALDCEGKEEVLQHLIQFKESFSIPTFFISHDKDEIYKLCDYYFRIDDNKLLSSTVYKIPRYRLDLNVEFEDKQSLEDFITHISTNFQDVKKDFLT